ncbi:rust resistance kinase Lr10-like [Rosa rugosa]|uniref:rust resistance kinase Lr10-like n=1 Tax=Rosa rugosa TaxID=74645 RepID=UPI002B40AB67|nr:rust resistance kinase Lr10-like [Rosa rugosa]
MSRGSLLFASYTILLLLPFTVISQTSDAENPIDICTSSCGDICISYPFRLKGDPQSCGNKWFELSCEANSTTAFLYLESEKYYVKSIHYNNFTIRVVDSGVQKKNNYCSTPLYPVTTSNFTSYGHNYSTSSTYTHMEPVPIILVTCATPMTSTLFIETAPCLNTTTTHSSKYSYFMVGKVSSFDLGRSCKITQMLLTTPSTNSNMVSCEGICDELVNGFELSWFTYGCGKCKTGELCELRPYNLNYNNRSELNSIECNRRPWLLGKKQWWQPIQITLLSGIYLVRRERPGLSGFLLLLLQNCGVYLAMYLAAKLIFGLPCITALLIYKWRRRHMSMYDHIEDFLLNNNNLMPVRYSYSEIKKMAEGFKDKLGEGGYGIVYKATLRSGRLVAIKMLGKSQANGQDFISEVATIGRIHHVNVVQLIGFCVDGSKRALVYDFMPNGSLDKYIFVQQGVSSLSFKKIFEISLGVARGIDYLHRGCDMQILHFDIKPHNILLDENFIPKVSDFGLARLYPLDNSIVSLTAVRGTIGYIAPELFYKNIGGVSYKADVYSFGMLLMEMAARRKNLNAGIEHSSQFSENYFPSWVSNQLNEGKDIEIEDATDDEMKTIKKMIVVALWCIQMKPSERPSMTKVVEMLEGELESLQIPPKPFLYPQEIPAEDIVDTSTTTGGSTMTESTEIN